GLPDGTTRGGGVPAAADLGHRAKSRQGGELPVDPGAAPAGLRGQLGGGDAPPGSGLQRRGERLFLAGDGGGEVHLRRAYIFEAAVGGVQLGGGPRRRRPGGT